MRGAGMMRLTGEGVVADVRRVPLAGTAPSGAAAAPAVAAPAMPGPVRPLRRILILSVSAGAGHVRAAQAICTAATGQGLEAVHIDLMDHVPRAYRSVYTRHYLTLVRRWPALWGWLYEASNRASRDGAVQRVRRAIERRLTAGIRRQIHALQPDVIVCTHFLPAEMLSCMPERRPVWVQVTDYDLHQSWVHPDMTGYFAPNEEVAFLMQASGIPAASIAVTGIPLMPGFAQRFDRAQCARALGLNPDLPTVLLMGGGAGLGGLDECAECLLDTAPGFQLVVLAGHNQAALQALQTLARRYPGRLLPLPFTEQVERVMACADLAITKPGGLSVSECLAQGLPMILHAPIPGQEDRNAEYLLEQGAALKAASPAAIRFRLRALLDDPARLARMSARARAAAAPDAADRVVAALLRVHA